MAYAQSLERLIRILDELREKCPWDKKQTLQSLRPQTVEELYELTEAISAENWDGIKEELGDLLLHLLFYCKIGSEQQQFTLGDVIESVGNKLVRRHPHVYSTTQVGDAEEVKQNWEKLKLKEGRASVLSGIPKGLPAMNKAVSLQEKSKQVGFEWHDSAEVLKKVEEELLELNEAISMGNHHDIEEEFGDVLFSLINYSRFIHVDPEEALERTNRKFIQRFQEMEAVVGARGQQLADMSLEEMDIVWNEVKHKLRLQQP